MIIMKAEICLIFFNSTSQLYLQELHFFNTRRNAIRNIM